MASIRQQLEALERDIAAARELRDAQRAARTPMSDTECAARLAALGGAHAHGLVNPGVDAYAVQAWPKVADILARAEQRMSSEASA